MFRSWDAPICSVFVAVKGPCPCFPRVLQACCRECLFPVTELLQQKRWPNGLFLHLCTISCPHIFSVESYFQQQQAVAPLSGAACCGAGLEREQSIPGAALRPLRLLTYHVQEFKLDVCNNMAFCKVFLVWGLFFFPKQKEQVMLKDYFPVSSSNELPQQVPSSKQASGWRKSSRYCWLWCICLIH